ncbi:MAG TPA: ABC transporter substrate-binding protein [Kofleriaceae bacterium]|nr:ABC transporter substrate-binding protein [Kofleriaceae bacterium]
MSRAPRPCLIAVGAVLVAAVAVAACDAGNGILHHRRDPGALMVAQPADISGLDLARLVDSESIEVGEILFEGLVRWRSGTTEIEPGLATSWQVSPDGLHWTFELRPGVTFHDGQRLDADAVVFSFLRVIDPHHPNYLGDADAKYWHLLLKDVTRVGALGASRIEITVARPYAPLLGELAMFPIVSPAAVRQWGMAFDRHPIGSGPFEFESWSPGEQVVVKRFDHYWGPAPKLERIVFRVVPDARQRLVDLQSGSVDLATAILPDEESFVDLHPDLTLLHAPNNDVSYLAMNTRHPPFTDRRVRRAINHAINKIPMVKLAYQGHAIPADGPLPPSQWGYHAPRTQYAYDPALARKLLAEAAADGAFDGTKIYKLYASITPRGYLSQPERVARYLQAALAQIGVRTELILQPLRAQFASTSAGEHDLALAGWISDTGDPDNLLYVLLHSDNAVQGAAQNLAFYSSPAFDKLVIDAQTAADTPTRIARYAEAQEVVADDAPWVPLAHSELVVAARADLAGVTLSPLGHAVYPWIYRRSEQR